MSKIIEGSVLILAILLSNYKIYPQLLTEEFNYTVGQALTANGWSAYSGSGSNPILVTSGSLTHINYPSSGIANSTQVIGGTGSREDVNRTFTSQTSGSVYASFLVNFSSATTAADGDYFFGFFNSTITTMKGRVFVKKSGSNIAFGVSKGATTLASISYSAFSYSLSTTYLLVLKYTFNASSSNDVINLFINPDLSGSEPLPDLTNIDNATDLSNVGAIALRQGVKAYNLIIDGIRVATSWSQAPLPVELSSFSASVVGDGVKLNWRTETEVNNYGFEIFRQAQDNRWSLLGFVEGHGNSNSPKEYYFIDDNVTAGKYAYRLKQIDNDGTFEFSKIIAIVADAPLEFGLSQNYPNPFNPSTKIKFSLPVTSNVKLSVFNILGEEVQILVNETKEAGIYTINFDAAQLNSGIYFYKLETRNFVQVSKMSLIR